MCGRFTKPKNSLSVTSTSSTEVRRPADVHLPDVFGVAREAMVEDLVGRKVRKSSDLGFVAHALDMEFTRAVAAFTAGFLRRGFR